MKKVWLTSIIVIIFISLISEQVKATIIFNDSFESGDYSAWTGNVTSEGETLQVSTGQQYNDAYSSESIASGSGYDAYVYRSFSPQTTIYHRFYVYISSTSGSTYTYFGGLRYFGGPSIHAIGITGSNNALFQKYFDGGTNNYVESATTLSLNQWHLIELMTVVSSTDGETRIYLNGTEVSDLTHTGLDNDGYGSITEIFNGLATSWRSATVYIDAVKVADTYIGPEDGTTTTTTSTTTTTTTSTTTSTTSTTTTIPTGEVSISGQLRNATGTIEANVSFYNEGTDQINASQITTDGNYGLTVWPGVYDIQFNIFYISNLFIKLVSLDVLSSLQNVVNYVNKLSNGMSFMVDITGDQEIQVYSDEMPNRILNNGSELQSVSSYSELTSNTWYYNSSENRLYMIVNPVVIITTTTITTSSSTTTTILGGLSRLHTEGRYIKDENNNTIFLRGINIEGYNYCPTGWWVPEGDFEYWGLTCQPNCDPFFYDFTSCEWRPEAIRANLEALSSWGANVVRFHIDLVYWLNDTYNYRQVLRDTAQIANEYNIYVIYDLASIHHEFPWPPLPFQPYDDDSPIDRQGFVDFWVNVSQELSYPNVIFEIYNEPHDITIEEFYSVHQEVVDAIREVSDNLIIIQYDDGMSYYQYGYDYCGLDWVEDYPINETNIVYSQHIYRRHNHLGTDRPSDYDTIRQRMIDCGIPYPQENDIGPVFIGETGLNIWEGGEEFTYFNNLLTILNEWEMSYAGFEWWVGSGSGARWAGMLQGGAFIPPPNEAGQILIDAIAAGQG